MKVKIFNEEFTIECNRFKKNIETIKEYYIYNSSNGLVKKVTRTVNVIPNLREFKRFFQTLLLHNLDSQICNTICTKVDWVLPNHDSFTAHPNNQLHISKIYTDEMYKIWRNRKNILIQYFKSIGITETYKEMEHDYDIKEFSIYCLK